MIAYSPTAFSQGRMDFAWEELTEAERAQAQADWEAGKGLIGGDPRHRTGSHLLPTWGADLPFFRTLALDDARSGNGAALRALLASPQPLEIEIGFGRGDFLLDRAQRYPERLLIGYETKIKATRLMLARIQRVIVAESGDSSCLHSNLWVSDDDARFSLPRVIADGRASMVHILFPDPWWKKEHKIRRLFSPPFVDLLAAKLQSGGLLHFKSDVLEYGELVRHLVENHPAFSRHDPSLVARIGAAASTHREHWCRVHDKPVWAYYFVRK